MNYTVEKIEINTSTEGLGGLPPEVYAETAEEMLRDYFEGAEIDLTVDDRYHSTEIFSEFEVEESPSGEGLALLMANDEIKEIVGQILQEAFDTACADF